MFRKKRISLLLQEIANFFQLWYLLGKKNIHGTSFFFNASSVLKLFPCYFFSYFRLNSFSTRWRNRWVYKVENMVVRFGQDMLRISLFHLVYYCWISHETMQRYYFLIFVFLNFRIFFSCLSNFFRSHMPSNKTFHFVLLLPR